MELLFAMRLPLPQAPRFQFSSVLLVSMYASQLLAQEPSANLKQADVDYREGVADRKSVV